MIRFTIVCTLLVSLGPLAPAWAELRDNAALGYWQAFAVLPQLNDNDRKTLKNWHDVDLEQEQVVDLIERSQTALDQLSEAAKIDACEWGLDLSRGVELLMPHLSKCHDLARLALLDARHRLAEGESDQALARMRAAAKLARDTGQPPLLITSLVEARIHQYIQQWLSDAAQSLTDKQKTKLLDQLDQLLPPLKLSHVLVAEADMLLLWLKKQAKNPEFIGELGADVIADVPKGDEAAAFMNKQIELLNADFQEMISAADGDATVLDNVEKTVIERAKTEPRLLTGMLMPSVTNARASIDRANTQTQMVRVALLLLTGDDEGAKAVKERTTGDRFLITKGDRSITVTGTSKDRDGKPRAMTFKLAQ